MKKNTSAILVALLFCVHCSAQTYFTRNGRITFFSKAPIENIEANNNTVTSILMMTIWKAILFQKQILKAQLQI